MDELVLIVDDNERNIRLARDILQVSGFRTIEASTGGESVSLASEHLPDVVLMDIRLPDMDGVEALRALRASEATASIPVVAVTALAMKGDRERFLEAGFDGYLEKPIDVRAFPRQVRGFCESKTG